jgi:hypothetical protein
MTNKTIAILYLEELSEIHFDNLTISENTKQIQKNHKELNSS